MIGVDMNKKTMLEQRIAMLEKVVKEAEDIYALDDALHDELIDDLNAFIRQCNSKFSSNIGSVNSDKSLKKTKSFKLIKALKDAWVNSARK